jgi:hypothetical protein
MISRICAALVLGLAIAGTAIAESALASERGGWEFTRWEMTLPEVLQASGGRVQSIDDPEKIKACSRGNFVCHALLLRDHKIGSHSFKVTFNFDQRGLLSLVTLEERGTEKFHELERQLLGAFGTPIDRRDVGRLGAGGFLSRTWRDERKGNMLNLLSPVDDWVTLNYLPISSGF